MATRAFKPDSPRSRKSSPRRLGVPLRTRGTGASTASRPGERTHGEVSGYDRFDRVPYKTRN